MTAQAAWAALDQPWPIALEEAWTSWCKGCVGVGAVIVDGDGQVVSTGRNRMLEDEPEPRQLSGTPLAHAEMNALARLRWGSTRGLTLFTSLEPCFMCLASITMAGISRVRFAAADPFWEWLHPHLREAPYCAERMPLREEPLPGPISVFAAALPMSFVHFWLPESPVVAVYRERAAALQELAEDINASGRLAPLVEDGATAFDAIEYLWPDLVRSADTAGA